MMPKLSRTQRLGTVIGISTCFFLAELSVGFYTHSLALVADAFHYLNDLVGFVIALIAIRVSASADSPKALSFGWQRAQLLGAFFNGVLLLTLGISIFLQSIERFISLQRVEDPKLMFILGCVGLGLNIISVLFLHGMMGALVHVIGDAANNLGVMAAALVIWLAHYDGRYYADPAASMGISVMILLSSIPIVRRAGLILLESAPNGVDLGDVKHDLEKIPGVLAIHELHIWRLNQHKSLASVHVVISDHSVSHFLKLAKIINECFHAYGIHSATLQPEVAAITIESTDIEVEIESRSLRRRSLSKCQIICGTLCEELTCCG
ncbi:hypothetical protein ASPZODRAFT_96615 [Penicilliopsis zonata CBS 506.65]|uniref:Cation efflux protein cytoplasmic domain-containing protein n=1 Tax=Penicilliopsis zonata CBS 506.65 TaxID=1073090 RepID=A0A1L9SGY6_9EURO|nr:hypothetical protein ASPZODRAFT_96615 [Penicilliopsis zonata CBS 506.65]OJJ46393.1 hypothetical protein ASPZODRAFT_96615 [Penicilliopsis zonata CBS 506.65]